MTRSRTSRLFLTMAGTNVISFPPSWGEGIFNNLKNVTYGKVENEGDHRVYPEVGHRPGNCLGRCLGDQRCHLIIVTNDRWQYDNKEFPCLIFLSSGICNPRSSNCGYLVHFFFARAKKKPNQRRNSPAHAKKLKIKACFPKRAKRTRSARLNKARFKRETSSIFFTFFC